MKGSVRKRLFPLFLAAVVTGCVCICMGMTALAKEAGKDAAKEVKELGEVSAAII